VNASAALLALVLTVLPDLAISQPPNYPLYEPYLLEPRGPYRGRVVDADTRAPLVGAVVVAVWYREKTALLHTNTVRYRAREVPTRDDGSFVIDARDVEEGAPERTRRPTFVIFYPRYELFNQAYEKFEGPGATVALRELKSWKEREVYGANVYPSELSDDPFRELPHLMRRINEERRLRGLNLYEPREK
jgi:hypothetical protein